VANEISVSSALSYVKNAAEVLSRAQAAKILSQAGVGAIEVPELSVPITEIAMPLGGLTTLGWCWFHNLDPTNFLHIRIATGGSKIVKVMPLAAVLFCFGVDVTVPYLIADTGSVIVEYLLLKP
jgi:hypothetical protein